MKNPFTLLIDWWAEYQRKFDLLVLWPSCKKYAPDLDTAKAAFALHAFYDIAWMRLGEKEVR